MKSAKRTAKKSATAKSESENRFSIHDFPTPAILYTKKNPVIVEWNSAASKLLGYKLSERPYLKIIRPKGMRARRNVSKSKVGVSMGIVPHTTGNGEEKLIEVIYKQITIRGKEYCLEWLVDQTALVQSQLSQLHFYGAVTRASIVSRADLDGGITYVNSNFIKISGYAQKELLGNNHHTLNSGYHPKSFWATMWKTITSGKTWRADVKNKAKDGSYYWVDTFIMPFVDEHGKVREFLSIQNDITLRKESEEALALSHSSLSETLIFGKMGSAELDLQTLELTVSKELFQLLELPEQEQRKWPLKLFLKTYVHRDFIPHINAKIQQGISGLADERKVVEMEFEMITSTGKKIGIEAEVIFTGNKALGILHDVSRQKKDQVELRKVYDELNAILNTSTDATFFLDSQYRIRVFNNTGSEQMKVINGGREVQQDESILEYLPKDTIERFKQNFRTALKGVPVFLEREVRINDTSSRWVHLRYLPVRNDEHKIIGVSLNVTDITSRKLAEQELFKSRKYFELMVNSQSSYLIRTDMEGNYTFVNAKFIDKFGSKDKDLLGTNSLDTIVEEDHDMCRQTVYNCFAHPGKVINVRLRKSNKEGGFYWTEWEFVALQDDQGNLIGVQAVGLDATERILAIQEMQEKEEHFRTLINDISIGILLQGTSAEIYLTNEAALDLLGLTEDQLLGRTSYSPSWNVIHEDGSDFTNTDMPVPRAIATKLPIRGVVMGVYRPKKNDRVWLLVDAIPRLDEYGNIRNVICTFNNITELKAAESSLQFTRFTINHTSDAVFWIRPDASVADMNPAAHNSLGYSAKEMLAMSLADIDVSFTDHKWHQFWKLLKEKKTLTSVTRLRKKDRTEVDVEINSNFIIFRDQEFNCVFIRNITERKKSEIALLDSNHEKDMLIKEIHHRVKNNLQLISSILYIKMNRMQQSEMRDFLEDTRQKIRSIALIHERLLQTNSVNQVDISDYLGKLISDLEMSNKRHELRIYIDRSIEPEEMTLDTSIYCGLIINELVTNSIKHAFVDRTAGNIRIVLRKMGDIHQLLVSDDGISMPKEIVIGQTGSFGMQMLEIFIKQIKGKVEINRQNGTSFNVLF